MKDEAAIARRNRLAAYQRLLKKQPAAPPKAPPPPPIRAKKMVQPLEVSIKVAAT